ncbi:MAG: hypothetical protein HYV28_12900 [Ignavibacteriales bacterium]|nr:hypothetical protein [Ignavibacteriales bacterium]
MASLENGIKLLQGRTVTGISVADPIPELLVNFSGGYNVRSVQMRTGEPEWTIRYFNGKFIRVYNGKLLISNESERLEKLEMWENEDMQLSDDAASRWGIPIELPKSGDCIDCKCFARLDGSFSFLDYGVCSNAKGVFDSKVVHFTSGCRAFLV